MNKTAIISLFLSSTLACSSSDECRERNENFKYATGMKCAIISTDFT